MEGQQQRPGRRFRWGTINIYCHNFGNIFDKSEFYANTVLGVKHTHMCMCVIDSCNFYQSSFSLRLTALHTGRIFRSLSDMDFKMK